MTVSVLHGQAIFGQVDSWVEVQRTTVTTADQRLLMEFSANSECGGAGPNCPLRILLDGVDVGHTQSFGNISHTPNGVASYETFAAVTDAPVSAGTHVVTVEVFTTNGTAFNLSERLVKVTTF